jgi:Arc/MetJ family transcription regulator
MRTTLNIDDQLLAEAHRITGVSEKVAHVRKVLGVGPRRYLEIKRLHELRARLRKTSYLQ